MSLYTPASKRKMFAVLFLLSLIIFLPGSYSVDSYNYYYQFSGGVYNDWHPPILAFVWKVLYKITDQYQSLYVVQMAVYWYMGYLLAARVINSKVGYWVCIGLFIFFQFIPQYVMKDIHAVLCWGIACLVMLLACEGNDMRKGTNVNYLLVFLLLAYGLFVRVNALVAIIPVLTAYVVWLIPAMRKGIKKWLVASAILISLLLVNTVITYRVFKAEKAYPEYKWMLLDIAGISKGSGTDYFPPAVTGYVNFNRDSIYQLYTPASFDHIYWPQTGSPMVPMPTEDIVKQTSRAWRTAILAHPFLYLKNRFEGFLYYLRIKHRFAHNEYWNVSIYIGPENPIKVSRPDNSIAYKFDMRSLTDTIFFDPWLWFLLNIVLTLYFFMLYRRMSFAGYWVMGLVQLSGILYMLSQFPVYQHDRDFRYNYWNVIVFMIGIVYAIGKPAGIQKEQLS